MAVSRTSLRIAWNRSDIDFTDADLVDRVVNGITEVWTAELHYDGDRVALVDVAKVATGDAVHVERDLEYGGVEPGPLDIWRLQLDGGRWERVTRFNRYASNPTVSPGGGHRLGSSLRRPGDAHPPPPLRRLATLRGAV